MIGLTPNYCYELNETDATGGARDTMGNATANGVFEGTYEFGPPEAGGPGATEVFGGIAVPGLGGEDNRAHYSNNAGHMTLGAGDLFASKVITVAMFLKAGPAEGGDRIFTNNVTVATTSFQIIARELLFWPGVLGACRSGLEGVQFSISTAPNLVT